jgi:hypothetical protein
LIDDTRQRDIQIANIRPNPNGKKRVFYAGKEIHTRFESGIRTEMSLP